MVKIEEGKSYRSRGGQKVGPMRSGNRGAYYPWRDDDGRFWTLNGESLGPEHQSYLDLIAEWQAEPAQPMTSDTPTASEPDWISWSGGECPVHPEAYVEYRTQNSNGDVAYRAVAKILRWIPHPKWPESNIFTYRVLWPGPAAKPAKPAKCSGEVWVNIHEEGNGRFYPTRTEADQEAYPYRLALKRVTWNEGDEE